MTFMKLGGIEWNDVVNPKDDAEPEPHELEGLETALVNTKSVFWDVGAYHGMYAIRLAKAGKRVIAFEPNPTSYKTLMANIESNNLGHLITAVNYAIGSVNGTVRFSDQAAMSNLSGCGWYPRTLSNFNSDLQVQCHTIDTLLFDWALSNPKGDGWPTSPFEPDFIKIDTEQHELEVIKGAVLTLLDIKPKLLVECHHVPLGGKRYLRLNKPVIAEMLKALGYAVQPLTMNQDKLFAWPSQFRPADTFEAEP